MLKRFIIVEPSGKFVASVYAESYRETNAVNSFTGAVGGGHFYRGDDLVASVDAGYVVSDSGGRVIPEQLRNLPVAERREAMASAWD